MKKILMLLVISITLIGCSPKENTLQIRYIYDNDRVSGWTCDHKQLTIADDMYTKKRFILCGKYGEIGDVFLYTQY